MSAIQPILASLVVDTGSGVDQQIDMSAYAKYALTNAIYDDVVVSQSVGGIGLYTGPNKTGNMIFVHQASVGGNIIFSGLSTVVQDAATLYVNIAAPHPGSLTLHLVGIVVP